jgi:hypothetical protein
LTLKPYRQAVLFSDSTATSDSRGIALDVDAELDATGVDAGPSSETVAEMGMHVLYYLVSKYGDEINVFKTTHG